MPFLGPPPENSPRAIIFDIGRVIIPVDLSRSMKGLGQGCGLSHVEVLKELQADSRWLDWEEGRMSPLEWHQHLTKKLNFSYSFDEFCAIWNSVLHPDVLLPDSFFEHLAAKSRLALLSNTDPIHVAHFETNFSFVRLFPVRVYSCRVGSSKPSPVIYHHALREANAMPDEAIFIDDLLENVRAAAALGINAFHYTSAQELLSEFSKLGLWKK